MDDREAKKLKQSSKLGIPPLCLASTSPRRSALLKSLGFSFSTHSPTAEEITPTSHENPPEVALHNAKIKVESLEAELPPEAVIVGADTIVVLKNRVLGKPRGESEVMEHLSSLSGQKHRVLTALALHSKKWGSAQEIVETVVSFRDLEQEEMKAYAKTPEPYDKAGSYAIQGLASLFVEKIEGSFTNVVGFPIEAFLQQLSALTKIPPFTWVCREH